MNNKIHPSAYIGDKVKLGKNNIIAQNVVIDGEIEIGDNNFIGIGTMITNRVIIGNDNKIIGNSSIGSPGEMGTKGDIIPEEGLVRIGNENTIREFVTINFPVRKKETSIGNNCYFMARTHIPHDADVRNKVVMATNSLIGGGSIAYDYAYIGLGSITHQWTDIGESAMIGLQAAVTKHVPPFCTVTGVPAKILKFNKTGAERRGFDASLLEEVNTHFKEIIQLTYTSENIIIQKIQEFIQKYPESLKSFII